MPKNIVKVRRTKFDEFIDNIKEINFRNFVDFGGDKFDTNFIILSEMLFDKFVKFNTGQIQMRETLKEFVYIYEIFGEERAIDFVENFKG